MEPDMLSPFEKLTDLMTNLEELDLPAVDFSGAAQRTERFIDDVTLRSAQLAEAVLENMSESGEGSSGGNGPDSSQASGEGQVLSDEQIASAVASCYVWVSAENRWCKRIARDHWDIHKGAVI